MNTTPSTPEISVILPVYNVADYIDVCMETVVNQTFTNIEILLINDGSTDGSSEKCHQWAEKDSRIRVIDKENEGVSAARNLGVTLARGKYLAFVDPDDWLDLTYLEKLRKPLEETGADFAECDLWRYDNRSGKKIYRSCYGKMGQAYSFRDHMKYAPTATYKALSRKALWDQYGIHMPSCSFESPAIYSLVLALSGRVESVREPLYYYRRFRENSLIENGYASKEGTPDPALGVEAMRFLVSEFRRVGLFDQYRETLEGVVKYRLSDILAMQFHRRSEAEFRLLVDNMHRFLGEAFPEGNNAPYITFGGYNLTRILTHMNWLHDPSLRFNFSSLISIVANETDASDIPSFTHKNKYRQIMLERERGRLVWTMIRERKPKYLFIDLIEERFDLISAGGRYLTKSDAYDGRQSGGFEEKASRQSGEVGPGAVVLRRDSETVEALWKQSAKAFVAKVREEAPGIRIVLVENYLSETVGDLQKQQPFEELNAIRRMNEILKGYYAYLETLVPEAVVIRPALDEPLYFTDKAFEYGALPSHLNEIVNQKIAARLEEALKSGGHPGKS